MKLTTKQKQAIAKGEATEITIEGQDCVIVSRDVYDRIRRLVEYDDGPLSEDERRVILQHMGQRAGWDDPELDVYEQYRKPS